MGWNEQKGEAWVLRRTMVRTSGPQPPRMLSLDVNGPLTIEDARHLVIALAGEIGASEMSDI